MAILVRATVRSGKKALITLTIDDEQQTFIIHMAYNEAERMVNELTRALARFQRRTRHVREAD